MYEEFVDLTKLPSEGLHLDRIIHIDAWKIHEQDWESRGDLKFHVSIRGKVQHKIVVEGEFSAGITAYCHRCLKGIDLDFKRKFHLTYLPPDAERFEKEEVALTNDELEVAYLEQNVLPLHEMIQEQIYLAVPMKFLCKAECRGLCPHCGVDLNLVECDCAKEQVDPRWASLKEIANNKK
jgi:uncharacterized protein